MKQGFKVLVGVVLGLLLIGGICSYISNQTVVTKDDITEEKMTELEKSAVIAIENLINKDSRYLILDGSIEINEIKEINIKKVNDSKGLELPESSKAFMIEYNFKPYDLQLDYIKDEKERQKIIDEIYEVRAVEMYVNGELYMSTRGKGKIFDNVYNEMITTSVISEIWDLWEGDYFTEENIKVNAVLKKVKIEQWYSDENRAKQTWE